MPDYEILPTAQWRENPHIGIAHRPVINDFLGSFAGIGSCFAQNLQAEVLRFGFDFWFNRAVCGHYSTESMVNVLEPIAEGRPHSESDLFRLPERPGDVLAYRYFFKKWFCGPGASEQAFAEMRAADDDCRRQIATCRYLVITLGTSRVMLTKAGQLLNAGMGIPGSSWTTKVLSVEDNVRNLKRIYDAVLKIRKGAPLDALFLTISPQRYLFGARGASNSLLDDDPFVDNMYCKSILRIAIPEFLRSNPDVPGIYFPSYEMVMEELRAFESISHYDFTHIDQVHTPKYVIKRFLNAYCSTQVLEQLVLFEKFEVLRDQLNNYLTGGMSSNHPLFIQEINKVLDYAESITSCTAPAIVAQLRSLIELTLRSNTQVGTLASDYERVVFRLSNNLVHCLPLSENERRSKLLALQKGMLESV